MQKHPDELLDELIEALEKPSRNFAHHVRKTDLGRVLELMQARYKLPPPEKNPTTYFQVANLLLRFAVGIDAINWNDFKLERDKFRGLKVADLGCGHEGARYDADADARKKIQSVARMYEPWLPRMLASMEADVTGVDVFPPCYRGVTKKGKMRFVEGVDPEWRYIKHDLAADDALDETIFPTDHFDVVNFSRVIDPKEPIYNDPRFTILLHENFDAYGRTYLHVLTEAVRMTREGGLCLLNEDQVKKVHGEGLVIGNLNDLRAGAVEFLGASTHR